MIALARSAVLLTIVVCASACGGESARTGVDTGSRSAGSPSGFAAKVKFDGERGLALKPMPDGAKLVDASEQELARYTIKEQLRVKVKDAADRELGQIRGDAAKIHVEGPGGERKFVLQRQADGDYRLETAGEALLAKVKKRDYGWKIGDATGAEVAKARRNADETSLRDAAGATILATKGEISLLAVACLGLEPIDLPLRVGLAVRIQAEDN